MMEPKNHSHEVRFHDAPEAEVADYRPLCGLAVSGLILGLLSGLAMLHTGFLVVGAVAAAVCLAAMVRISRDGAMVGKGFAVAGLVLAVFWTSASLAKDATHARLMDRQSREIGVLWFGFLRDGEPEKALELQSHPAARRPFNDNLIDHYLTDELAYEALAGFVTRDEVHAVLELGSRAQVRFYGHEGHSGDVALQLYAVTYEQEGTKKSFFVRLRIRRVVLEDHDLSAWYIDGSDGPIVPEDLQTASAT